MLIDKLTSTTAFVITDLDGADQAAGVVRLAPKVLQGSSIALARTASYLFAARELQISGASAGISAEPAARADALAAFVEEVRGHDGGTVLVFDPGTGVTDEDLAPLAGSDPRDPVRDDLVGETRLREHLDALGAVVAAEAALGGLEGRTAAVELGPTSAELVRLLTARGASVVAAGGPAGSVHDPGGLDAATLTAQGASGLELLGELEGAEHLSTVEASVLFCGGRQGMIDGPTAEALGAGLVVPTGCQPVSAKGLAVLRRRGVAVLADFVTTSGPTYAGWPVGEATVEAVVADATGAITAQVSADLTHEEGPLLGACYRAEAFLGTWQDTLPFGRPLA